MTNSPEEFISGSQVAKDHEADCRRDCVEEDLRRPCTSKLGKTTEKQRVTLSDIAEDREGQRTVERVGSTGICG